MSKSNHNQIHHRTLWVTRTGVLITALIGGSAAMAILPVLKEALSNRMQR